MFPNGLVLLAEPMDYVRTAAFNFLIPAGYAYDSAATPGTSNLLSGMISRGAGPFDNKQLMLEGILSLEAEMHPAQLEEQLKAFLAPSDKVRRLGAGRG